MTLCNCNNHHLSPTNSDNRQTFHFVIKYLFSNLKSAKTAAKLTMKCMCNCEHSWTKCALRSANPSPFGHTHIHTQQWNNQPTSMCDKGNKDIRSSVYWINW